MNKYKEKSELLKALADATRLEIVDMLSCGELCGCKILEHFHITQPTLSHHMKTLCDCGLVLGRKEGKWMYYSLNEKSTAQLKDFVFAILTKKDECVCNACKESERG